MYVKELNLLFIHIPKTSGQSIKRCFRKSEYEVEELAGIPEHHKTIKDYMERYNWNVNDIKQLNTVTIIRNPYERYRSYLRYVDDRDWNKEKNDKRFAFIRPQHEFIYYKNELLVKNFFKYEDRKDINNFFLDKYKFKLEVINKSKSKNYKILTEKQIAFCNKMYEKDFELFNYERIKL